MLSDALNFQASPGESLVRLAIVHDPACDMPALWIMVRPMDDTAFCIPDVLTAEAHTVAYLEPVNTRSDVDVVSDQDCLS